MKGISDQQQRFLDFLMAGMPAGRAYEKAGYVARGAVADVNAARLLTNAKVKAAHAAMREEAAARAGMTRDELVNYLVDVVRTPVGRVDATSPLAQEWRMDEKGMTVKMPNKLMAAKQLADILGWNEPEKVKVEYEVVIGGGGNE